MTLRAILLNLLPAILTLFYVSPPLIYVHADLMTVEG